MCECPKKCLARCGLLGTCKPLRAATLTLSSLLLLKLLLLLQVMSKTEKDEIFGCDELIFVFLRESCARFDPQKSEQ